MVVCVMNKFVEIINDYNGNFVKFNIKASSLD